MLEEQKAVQAEDIEEHGTFADRLLFWLLKHPYQRMSDLVFVFQASTSTIWRHLQKLNQDGLVEAVVASVSGNRPEALHYLSSRGVEQVSNLVGGMDASRLARSWNVDEGALLRLLPRLSSYLPLQDAVLHLVEDAPAQLAYQGGYPAAIRWHWQHDYLHAFEHKKKRMTFRSDGAVVLRCRPQSSREIQDQKEAWYCLLFLIDPGFCGSEDLHLMRDRLERLLLWRETSERWSFYRSFPPVLILAPTTHQRDLWIYSAQEATSHLRLASLKGACAVWSEGSPWRYDWRSLDGTGLISLHKLVQSIAPEAIPPGLLAPKQIEPAGKRKECQVVTGNFEVRSKRLTVSGNLKKGMDISLLSLHLCHRHFELLKQVYALPLVAPYELVALLSKGKELATQKRYLYDLQKLHCLELTETPGGKRLVLTETGLRLIAVLLGVPIVHIAERNTMTQQWQQRGIRPARRIIKHTTGVYSFLAQLQSCRQGEILWWETTRSFRRYHYQGAWHNLMPDALFEYRSEAGERVEAWLEWDTGSMHLKPLIVKLEAYAQYIRSQQFRHEHKKASPNLLLIAPQNGREQSLRRIAASVLTPPLLGTLSLWTTTAQLLQAQGPLDAIWKPMRLENGEENEVRVRWINQ